MQGSVGLRSVHLRVPPCERRGNAKAKRAGWGGLRGGGKAIMSLSGRRTMWCQSSRIRKVSRALLRIDWKQLIFNGCDMTKSLSERKWSCLIGLEQHMSWQPSDARPALTKKKNFRPDAVNQNINRKQNRMSPPSSLVHPVFCWFSKKKKGRARVESKSFQERRSLNRPSTWKQSIKLFTLDLSGIISIHQEQ